ncbi:MAG: hypothetical protein AB1540_03445 [Bdellovibrionota bacterium]
MSLTLTSLASAVGLVKPPDPFPGPNIPLETQGSGHYQGTVYLGDESFGDLSVLDLSRKQILTTIRNTRSSQDVVLAAAFDYAPSCHLAFVAMSVYPVSQGDTALASYIHVVDTHRHAVVRRITLPIGDHVISEISASPDCNRLAILHRSIAGGVGSTHNISQITSQGIEHFPVSWPYDSTRSHIPRNLRYDSASERILVLLEKRNPGAGVLALLEMFDSETGILETEAPLHQIPLQFEPAPSSPEIWIFASVGSQHVLSRFDLRQKRFVQSIPFTRYGYAGAFELSRDGTQAFGYGSSPLVQHLDLVRGLQVGSYSVQPPSRYSSQVRPNQAFDFGVHALALPPASPSFLFYSGLFYDGLDPSSANRYRYSALMDAAPSPRIDLFTYRFAAKNWAKFVESPNEPFENNCLNPEVLGGAHGEIRRLACQGVIRLEERPNYIDRQKNMLKRIRPRNF